MIALAATARGLASVPATAGGATLSIDRSASNLEIAGLTAGAAPSVIQPTGGSISVNDYYRDPSAGIDTAQTASGPTVPGDAVPGTGIVVARPGCWYKVQASYSINSVTPGDPYGVHDYMISPPEPIPSNLVLKGSVTIPACAADCPPGLTGLYDVFGNTRYGLAWTR